MNSFVKGEVNKNRINGRKRPFQCESNNDIDEIAVSIFYNFLERIENYVFCTF